VSDRRVVSLVPSATETLLALGADVIACTRFCEQPTITHVGGTKNPDLAAIVAMAPDLVVLDEEENRREDAEALAAAGLPLAVTAVRSVAAAVTAVDELARRVERPAPSLSVPIVAPTRVSAFVPIWRRPWMTINADTYGASVLATVGVGLVTADAAERYPVVELDDIASSAPSMVLVPTEPYAFTDAHVADLAARFPGADVRRIDGQDLFWWGVRTPVAIERVRSALAPR
jgi:hypothetical protein